VSYIPPSDGVYVPDPDPDPNPTPAGQQELNSTASDEQQIQGEVERVAFHRQTSGYCVLKVKISGSQDLVNVIGSVVSILPGECVHATGRWENHSTYGTQFKAKSIDITMPITGIEWYLGSGLIKGIGPEIAKRLVNAFGDNVIAKTPERLTEIEGIGAILASRIEAAWTDQKEIRDIMVFLHSHRVGTAALAVRICKTYGADAIRLVSEDPYRLARDLRGVGFLTADKIAENFGVCKTSEHRLRAGLQYALTIENGRGHCGVPEEHLLLEASYLLGIPAHLLTEALEAEIRDHWLVAEKIGDQMFVFPPHLQRAEQVIADRLSTLRRGRLPWERIDADAAIPMVEASLGVTLADSQRNAVAVALRSKVMVITGGPGVGKTTILNSILHILAARGVTVALAAPTGRAARRMSETTGMEAKTIHRLLEFDPTNHIFNRSDAQPLECDLLVIDETSMVDVPLMASLLKAIPDGAAVILVGDVDQLPSVGPGQVLADIIAAKIVPVAKLTEVFRQAADSRILTNAHRINRGEMPDLMLSSDEIADFYFIDADEPITAIAKIVEEVTNRIPNRFGLDPIRDVQVLCPTNIGPVGTKSLNNQLQAVLNPGHLNQPCVGQHNVIYRVGDKVMQIVNNYEKDVFNGDIGFITAIDTVTSELTIDFGGSTVVYMLGELGNLVPAYATTIHKSQGSEYSAIVIPIMTSHRIMLTRRLLYTAVTRGKKLVVLVGQRKAIEMAVAGGLDQRRWSKLRERLMAARR